MIDEPPVVAAVLVAYGAQPTLQRCLTSLRESTGVVLETIVVDNGADATQLSIIDPDRSERVLGPSCNRGFTGGCNAGAAATTSDYILLLNTDAFVEPEAIARLVEAVDDPTIGIATASLRLSDRPDRLNSAGNPVHFSGISWSGAFDEPAAAHSHACDVAAGSGAAMILRRDVWEALGGFDDGMFAYLEDAELSLRCWQLGLRVRFAPEAVVLHEYEFGRHPGKYFLLERNRLFVLATLYEVRTLVVLTPALLLVELALLVQSVAGGWLRAKLRAYWWMLTNLHAVRARRRDVQQARCVSDATVLAVLSGRIEPTNIAVPPGMTAFNTLLNTWWVLARRVLGVPR